MRSETANRLRKQVKTTYNRIAKDFDRTRQALWPEFEQFTPHLPSTPRVLDVGCGNGRLLKYFEDKPLQSYLGIDNSSSLLALARSHYKGNASIRFREGDILNLPLKKESYNAVFSLAVLHHIPSRELQQQALSELSRVMSPDGVLFLSVWDLYRWKVSPSFIRALGRFLLSFGNTSWKDLSIPWGKRDPVPRYCHAFTARELRKLLKEAGFEVDSFTTTRKGRFGNHVVVARPFLASRTVSVMGVPFHGVRLDEAVEVVGTFLKSNRQHMVVTPNPEILLKARKDPAYRALLSSASLSVADGIGVLWAAFVEGSSSRLWRFIRGILGGILLWVSPRRVKRNLPERVTGVDLMEALCHHSHRLKAKVFLLGAAPGVAKAVAEKWRFDAIVGTYAGSPHLSKQDAIVRRIQDSGANLLFVAYGAPRQEEWIARNLKKMSNVRVAIGVGGAFDFVAGVRQRAPESFRRLGIEWLWRLLQEPRRVGRILNATVVFPLTVIFRSK